MDSVIAWVTAHYQDVLAIYSSIIIAARLIIKILPYPNAGTILEKVVVFLSHVGLTVKTPAA